MITEKLQKAINDQITAELWSSNLYLQMSYFLEKEGWSGCARWMMKQSEEEKEHANELAHYLIKRGGEAKVSMIDVVPAGEKDKASQDFLWGFVREQVEEEATASDIVAKIKRAGESGLFFIDSQLAQR